MKKRFAYFGLVLLICFSLLGGCGFQALTGGPAITDAVTGNGGMVVQKGDYLYFANGYVSTDDLSDGDNAYGDVDNSAIYRAKLINGELSYDEDGNLLNTEIVVPKIAGFENTGIYIFDDYIYYATPNTNKGDEGTVNFELIDFCRAKLNGTDVTTLYKTDTTSDDTAFSFYKINSTVYLVVYDGSKIVSVNTSNKTETTICEDVTSAVLPNVTEYNPENNTINDSQTYVYYTRSAKDDEDINYGNVLAKASVTGGSEIVVMRDNNNTYTVENITTDALYYTKKIETNDNAYYFLTEFVNDELDFNTEVQIAYMSYTSTVLFPEFQNGFQRGLITTNSGGYLIWVNVVNDVPNATILYSDSTLTPLYVQGDYVFAYDSNNDVYKINFKTLAVINITTADDVAPNFTMKTKIDYDNSYIYFYNTYTNDDYTSYYLVRINTLGNYERTVELVGKIETIHLPSTEE